VGVDLREQLCGLPLDGLDRVSAGNEPQRRGILGGDRHQSVSELGWVAALLATLELLRSQLLEEARIEVAGIVDQHVDPAEAVERSLHRHLRRSQARIAGSHHAARSAADFRR
jgi:hypothetical protein